MYGRQLRIGLMVPCVNAVMRPELSAMAPDGVELYETRMLMRGSSKLEQLQYMMNSLHDTVETLADVADVFVYGCTSGSFTKGRDFDRDLTARIAEQADRPAVSAAGALLKALERLGAGRILLATPYLPEVNRLQQAFFQSAGITVAAMEGLALARRGESGTLPPRSAYELAKRVWSSGEKADALVISCTNFRTAEILEQLETETGLPAVSSNQASLWAALRAGGLDQSISGFGTLLRDC